MSDRDKNSTNTAIVKFKVVVPALHEEQDEILALSMFGEYCPKQSLRGYSLSELLAEPERYQIIEVMEKGIIKPYQQTK